MQMSMTNAWWSQRSTHSANYIVPYKEIGGVAGGGGGVGRSREQTSDNHNRNEKPRSKLLCPLTKSKPNNPKEFKEHPPIQPSHCLWLLRKEPLFPRLPLLSLIIFLWARAGAPYLPSNKTVEWFIRFSAT